MFTSKKCKNSQQTYLDDNCMGRKVYSPGQGGSADQNLDMTFGKHALHKTAVRP